MSINRIVCLAIALLLPMAASAALPIPGRIVKVVGEEAVSQPYRFEVDIDAAPYTNPLANLINSAASFILPNGHKVTGVVDAVRAVRRSKSGVVYRLVITPKFADGLHTQRLQIFQEMATPDIAQLMLEVLGQQVEISLQQDTSNHPLAMQYSESDVNFLHRLFEADGIYYYFDHSGSQSTLVLRDSSTNAPNLAVDVGCKI